MVQTIMALFGYVKVPKELVQLSVEQENFIVKMIKYESDPRGKVILERYLVGQKTITEYLRSGRLISE